MAKTNHQRRTARKMRPETLRYNDLQRRPFRG